MLTNEEIQRRWDALDAELKAQFGKSANSIEEIGSRLREIEQRIVRRRSGGGDDTPDTAGHLVTKSEPFKGFGGSMGRGKFSVQVPTRSITTTPVYVKAITSATGSGGAFVQADHRPDPVLLPRRRLTIRDLIAPGTTTSNAIEYPRQTTRTNSANTVAEGASKPESDYAFELVTANVRTIAHWVTASKQALDDSTILANTIDSELRYGLALKEEEQLLEGDGTGQNLHGIIPQASDFSPALPFPGQPQRFDTLLLAIAQVEAALFPATGIVLNDQDLRSMQVIKNSDGDYIGGGPFGPPITSIWGVPVVGTPAMSSREFVVGAFRDGSQLFDRETAVVEISTEHSDYFTRNLIAVRAEERLAFTVKRPTAFVHGEFGDLS